MRGLITEQDFEEAEVAFPGIARFYADLPLKPRTFLELSWLYLRVRETRSAALPRPGCDGKADLAA